MCQLGLQRTSFVLRSHSTSLWGIRDVPAPCATMPAPCHLATSTLLLLLLPSSPEKINLPAHLHSAATPPPIITSNTPTCLHTSMRTQSHCAFTKTQLPPYYNDHSSSYISRHPCTPQVIGLLDWGDATRCWRAVEVAVAATYAVLLAAMELPADGDQEAPQDGKDGSKDAPLQAAANVMVSSPLGQYPSSSGTRAPLAAFSTPRSWCKQAGKHNENAQHRAASHRTALRCSTLCQTAQLQRASFTNF